MNLAEIVITKYNEKIEANKKQKAELNKQIKEWEKKIEEIKTPRSQEDKKQLAELFEKLKKEKEEEQANNQPQKLTKKEELKKQLTEFLERTKVEIDENKKAIAVQEEVLNTLQKHKPTTAQKEKWEANLRQIAQLINVLKEDLKGREYRLQKASLIDDIINNYELLQDTFFLYQQVLIPHFNNNLSAFREKIAGEVKE